MRYSVRYDCKNKNWLVADGAGDGRVIGTHILKANAYRHAFAEQERWRGLEPAKNYATQIRKSIPLTLVVG
jgi:hypothetical protein